MSRKWKPLPTHLPGWGLYREQWQPPRPEFNSFVQAKKRARKRRNIQKRNSWARRQHGEQRSKNRTHPTPVRRPDTEQLLWVNASNGTPPFCAGAVFQRRSGVWRCTEAAPIIEWMTRVQNPPVILNWLKAKEFSYEWVKPMPETRKEPPSGSTPRQAEQAPARQPISTSPPHSEASIAQVSGGLEQNGLTSPRCLIAGGVPGNTVPSGPV